MCEMGDEPHSNLEGYVDEENLNKVKQILEQRETSESRLQETPKTQRRM